MMSLLYQEAIMPDVHQSSAGSGPHQTQADLLVVVPAEEAEGIKTWQVLALVLFGILAFVGGTWYFVFPAQSPVASSASLPANTPASSDEATTSTPTPSASAEAAEAASASSSGEPATTPDSSRLTRANFDQIHKGMTEDQ